MVLKCSGFDPRVGKPTTFVSTYFGGELPISQRCLVPTQSCYLSHDLVDFGNVPQYCQSNRIVIIRNKTQSDQQFFIDDTNCLPLEQCPLLDGPTLDVCL